MSDETKNFPDYVNWQYFTSEERNRIIKLTNLGEFDMLASAIYSNDYTVAKEREIARILDREKPKGQNFKSKVQEELERLQGLDKRALEAPEQEAYWEQRRADEFQAFREGKLTPTGESIGEFELPDRGAPPGIEDKILKKLKSNQPDDEDDTPRPKRGRPRLTIPHPTATNAS